MYNYITAKNLYFFLKLLYLFIDVFIPIIYFYVCHFASSMDLKRHDAASFITAAVLSKPLAAT